MQLVILGPPGSGKGSLAKDIRSNLGIQHISTGDIFRENIEQKTRLGVKANEYISKGQLVPDDITIKMVGERLAEADCNKGFILDGFPRTIPQAHALNDILAKLDQPLTAVIDLIISDEIAMERLTSRRICKKCGFSYNMITLPPTVDNICDKCGGNVIQRDDDKAETIANRLVAYHKQTQPLIDFYRSQDLLIEIVNEGEHGQAIKKVLPILTDRK